VSAPGEKDPGEPRPCQCEAFAAVTEQAALASARWLGRGDVRGAQESATSAMRQGLDKMEISGRIVVGGDEEEDALAMGATVGRGGEEVDLAVDPLEGRSVVARGDYGAMSMIAVGESASFPRLPQMYMRKIAVGPVGRGKIDLSKPVGDNVRALAEAFGRRPNDITAIVLDRPRHHDLIEEIRAADGRIKLIQDGDVTASITTAIRGTNDHITIGIGGARQAVLSAAALRCLGGELQAQLWPTSRTEIDQAAEHGIDDVYRVFTTDELAPGEVIVAATGVTNGDLLRGVRFLTDSARTHSIVMCTRHNWVRFVDGIHFFARERREEVRLLG
jgi:fructose-1,6-bisphosphatase II